MHIWIEPVSRFPLIESVWRLKATENTEVNRNTNRWWQLLVYGRMHRDKRIGACMQGHTQRDTHKGTHVEKHTLRNTHNWDIDAHKSFYKNMDIWFLKRWKDEKRFHSGIVIYWLEQSTGMVEFNIESLFWITSRHVMKHSWKLIQGMVPTR